MKNSEAAIGVQVQYLDWVNLRYVGEITFIGTTRMGGDCLVKWATFPFPSEECLSNLELTPQQRELDAYDD
jgi:hypothetical protein